MQGVELSLGDLILHYLNQAVSAREIKHTLARVTHNCQTSDQNPQIWAIAIMADTFLVVYV